MKIIRIAIILIWSIALAALVNFSLSETFNYSPLMYWWFVLGLVFIIWSFHLKDIFSLKLSFGTFIVGGLLITFGIFEVGEILMKFAFILLLVGFTHTVIRYNTTRNAK